MLKSEQNTAADLAAAQFCGRACHRVARSGEGRAQTPGLASRFVKIGLPDFSRTYMKQMHAPRRMRATPAPTAMPITAPTSTSVDDGGGDGHASWSTPFSTALQRIVRTVSIFG